MGNMDEVRKCGEIFIDEDDLFSFICTFCESPFQEVDNFFLHIKEDHEQKYKLNKEKNERESHFDEQDEISIHIPEIEMKDISYGIEINYSSDISKKEVKYEVFENCDFEDFENECSSDCLRNIKENSDEESDEIETNEDESKSEKNCEYLMSEKRKNQLECSVCGKCFVNEARFKFHKERVKCIAQSNLKCDRCGKHFGLHRNYKRHVLWSKRCRDPKWVSDPIIKKKSLKCKYCDERFPPFNNMLEEHERTHTGERPFQCHICGKQFRTKLLCENHEKLHTGEKLFKCHICNLEFRSSGNLYSHKQRHGEKKFSCGFCEKSFFRKSEKTSHERIHTGDKPYNLQV